jgi:Protein of unknown function (DUF3592)
MNATIPIRNHFPASTVFIGLMVACALEFFAAAAFLPVVYHRADSISWPISTGMISGVKLNEWSHKPHAEAMFKPVVLYDYTVNGVRHQGDRVSFEDSDGVRVLTKKEATAWIDRNYPIGKRLPVYYDPRDPNLAVLQPGAEELIMICQYIMGVLAFCFLLAFIRYRIARRTDLESNVELDPIQQFNHSTI